MSKRKKKPGALWVNHAIVYSPIKIGVCVTEEQFQAELERMKVPKERRGTGNVRGNDATTHFYEKTDGEHGECCIVCFNVESIKSNGKWCTVDGTLANLCAHEAQHVWLAICRSIGEEKPSEEFSAYAVGNITQYLYEAVDSLVEL
jgi:hypothetical protein